MKIASKPTKSTGRASVLKSLPALASVVTGLLIGVAPAAAAPILGSSLASFAVLGALGVTNVPTSTIGGNLGSAPNPSSGGGYVFTSGSLQPNTGLAQQAQLDLDAAILAVNAGGGTPIAGGILAGTIGPGIYDVGAATANITGALVLDGGGSNTAVWRFRFSSDLIAATGSTVSVINVGDGSGVGIYWTAADGATLNGNTFAGNVLARTLISSDGDSDGLGPDLALTLACGRLASATAQVTLIQDTISIGCTTGMNATNGIGAGVNVANSGGFDQGTVPEPGSLALLGLGLAALGLARRRRG